MKMHLKRIINFGQTSKRACSWITTEENTFDKKIFDTLADNVKCQRCVKESNKKWKSSLLK